MTKHTITLESGKEYTLSELFSGKNKIIIPDLQRDYCWGDKAYNSDIGIFTELVSGFLGSLLSSFSEKPDDKLTLGLIYGYENPKYHIQLCDGQQRITTLFLILGMINRMTENNEFQNFLISTFELLEDDQEPFLQYAIRESTLYFLSDLVCNFFLNKDKEVSHIYEEDWYFNEYDLDASIQSMLRALSIIEQRLKNINFSKFGNFIVSNLQMIYYDMGNRTRGEETFVVINTTGEPLTATENLKPKIISLVKDEYQKEAAEEWEGWDDYFWIKRGNNNISDIGFNEFLRWITIINSESNKAKDVLKTGNYSFNIDEGSFNQIKTYINCIEWLFDNTLKENRNWLSPKQNSDKKHNITQLECLILLPLIEYIHVFGYEQEREIKRLYQFLLNLTRIENVKKAINEIVPLCVRLVSKLKESSYDDIAYIIKFEDISTLILSKEERLKFKLFLNSSNREELEKSFWEAESHKILSGEILPLIEWATIDNIFSLEKFQLYHETFRTIFKGNCEHEELDMVRRALLTRDLNHYPRIFRGYTNTSFCWEHSDWKTLLFDNREKFGMFFNELLDSNNIDEQLKRMIDESPESADWAEFVKIPELLKYTKRKNIQHNNNLGWFLLQGSKMSGAYANLKSYRFFLDMKSEKNWDIDKWTIDFYDRGKTCTYFDLKNGRTAIDVIYQGNDQFIIQVFNKDEKIDSEETLNALATERNLVWNGKRYESTSINQNGVIEELIKIQSSIEISS